MYLQIIVLFSFYILVHAPYIEFYHFMLFNNQLKVIENFNNQDIQCILEPFSCQYILAKGSIVLICHSVYEP